ncbi:hypothetical protein WKV44_01110 [Spirochaetia bacterium 38H-sp]|uniref:Transglutaminase-like domain-containing protein n=1 Tax=Rarispira pelagica TaxID=3141764 RepID=A0ABU9U8Z6_9SPIR
MKSCKSVLLFFSLIFGAVIHADPYTDDRYGFIVEPPVDWQITQSEKGLTATSPDGSVVFQVAAFESDKFESSMDIAAAFLGAMEAKGDTAGFVAYDNNDCILADASFDVEQGSLRGFFVFINDAPMDYIVMSYAPQELYDKVSDLIISSVNSFSPSQERYFYPGPISQFFYPVDGPQKKKYKLNILDTDFAINIDPGEEDASQVMIEREARILMTYKDELAYRAWERYYRLITRDQYVRLAPLVSQLEEILAKKNIDVQDYPNVLLKWLQGFDFKRSGTISDLIPPVSCLTQKAGDCDSLALTYLIILHYFGFDGILMLSSEYAHAMAAVDTAGDGARFSHDRKRYLVAELTDDVPIGMIASDMSDPAKWIGVSIFKYQ